MRHIDEDELKAQAEIVVRLENKFRVKYVDAVTAEEVGKLGFTFPELGLAGDVPYYNKGYIIILKGEKGEMMKLGADQFLVKFGEFPIIGTQEQIREMWLWTYAMTKALETMTEEPEEKKVQ